MTQLTKNFTLEEMTSSSVAESYHINNTPSEKQVANLKRLCEDILQPIRDKWGYPITVTSGYRCVRVNTIVKGAKNSQHVLAEAADIKSKDNNALYKLICGMMGKGEIVCGQLIQYTHVNDNKILWIHISLPTAKHKNQKLHIYK